MEMTPGRAVTTYLLTVPIFLAIDLLWLGVVAKDLYRKHLGYLLSPRINWAAAITFYLVFVAGIVLFAVRPGIEAGQPPARAGLRSGARVFRLRHVRSDQSRDDPGLAAADHRRGSDLGHHPLWQRRLDQLPRLAQAAR